MKIKNRTKLQATFDHREQNGRPPLFPRRKNDQSCAGSSHEKTFLSHQPVVLQLDNSCGLYGTKRTFSLHCTLAADLGKCELTGCRSLRATKELCSHHSSTSPLHFLPFLQRFLLAEEGRRGREVPWLLWISFNSKFIFTATASNFSVMPTGSKCTTERLRDMLDIKERNIYDNVFIAEYISQVYFLTPDFHLE